MGVRAASFERSRRVKLSFGKPTPIVDVEAWVNPWLNRAPANLSHDELAAFFAGIEDAIRVCFGSRGDATHRELLRVRDAFLTELQTREKFPELYETFEVNHEHLAATKQEEDGTKN